MNNSVTEWRFIDSGACTASYNMAADEAISLSVRRGDSPPTLRVYGWERPSVSIGSFQKIACVNIEYCRRNNVPVVRRPTGGRGILHGDEFTYSFSSRNEGFFSEGLLGSYRKLGEAFKSAFDALGLGIEIRTKRESGRDLSVPACPAGRRQADLTRSPLCFKSISYGELSFEGRKLTGSAQKRWKDGLLQQGSIPYSIEEENLRNVFSLASTEGLRERMIGLRELLPGLDPDSFKEAIRASFEGFFGITFNLSDLSPEEDRLVLELETRKYLSPEWNSQR